MAVLVNLPRQVVYAVVPCNYLLVVKREVGCGKMGSHMCIDDRYYRQLIERCHCKEDILNILFDYMIINDKTTIRIVLTRRFQFSIYHLYSQFSLTTIILVYLLKIMMIQPLK